MTILQVGLTLLAALLSGAFGGIISAGGAARRAEQSKDRYRAEIAIRATLLSYKAMLIYDHDQVYVVSTYPQSYAEIKGQEKLAEDVLRRLPFLTVRTRKKIRGGLSALISPASLEWVEKYIDVPADARNMDGDDRRQFIEQYRALQEHPHADGLIRRLIRSQNDPSHADDYAAALAKFDELLALLKIDKSPRWKRAFHLRRK